MLTTHTRTHTHTRTRKTTTDDRRMTVSPFYVPHRSHHGKKKTWPGVGMWGELVRRWEVYSDIGAEYPVVYVLAYHLAPPPRIFFDRPTTQTGSCVRYMGRLQSYTFKSKNRVVETRSVEGQNSFNLTVQTVFIYRYI